MTIPWLVGEAGILSATRFLVPILWVGVADILPASPVPTCSESRVAGGDCVPWRDVGFPLRRTTSSGIAANHMPGQSLPPCYQGSGTRYHPSFQAPFQPLQPNQSPWSWDMPLTPKRDESTVTSSTYCGDPDCALQFYPLYPAQECGAPIQVGVSTLVSVTHKQVVVPCTIM